MSAVQPDTFAARPLTDDEVRHIAAVGFRALKERYKDCPQCIEDISAAVPGPGWEAAIRAVTDYLYILVSDEADALTA